MVNDTGEPLESIDIMVDEKQVELDRIFNEFNKRTGVCTCPLCHSLNNIDVVNGEKDTTSMLFGEHIKQLWDKIKKGVT